MAVPQQSQEPEATAGDPTEVEQEQEQEQTASGRAFEWLFSVLVFWPLGLAALGILGFADDLSGLPDLVLFGPWILALAGVFVFVGADELKREGRVTLGRAITAVLAFAFALYLIKEVF